MRTASDRLRELGRRDKWYLSCGDGIIWAPPLPRFLHFPGFWDEAMVLYHPFAPLFTVAVVTPDGEALRLTEASRMWYPHKLVSRWHADIGGGFVEERYATPGGRLTSAWRIDDESDDDESRLLDGMHLVAFTAQPGEHVGAAARGADRNSVSWHRTLYDRREVPLGVTVTLRADANESVIDRARTSAIRSEGVHPVPNWRHTPFWEYWEHGPGGGLAEQTRLQGLSNEGVVYLAIDVPLLGAPGEDVAFTIELTPQLEELDARDGESTIHATSGAGRSPPDPAEHWVDFFEAFPSFACSDPFFSRYFDYRIYGLLLNRLAGGSGNVKHPAIAEGIGYFHVPITFSAQCHMWETRWARTPALARGSLLNFLTHQRQDGSLHGRIYTNHMVGTDYYHANWGDAVLAVDSVHPDPEFLEVAYDGLSRFANWLDVTRDSDDSGLYEVVNHFETGQEFMSRYQLVSSAADLDGWEPNLRLKGVDVTVYAYQLKRALQSMAPRLGRPQDAAHWAEGANRTGRAMMEMMWDPHLTFFSDIDSRTQRPTGAKAAVCFYPLLTDLLDSGTMRDLLRHLVNPAEFGTDFPVPSSSLDDPYFNAHAEWKGKRHNCPWNGRTWPMTNSHIVEGLLRQWQRGRREAGPVACHVLERFVRMMFLDGDVEQPNCYEHYNPLTGHPSAYRGIDDYQHSWVLDLLIRGVAGLEPQVDGILVDPLPFDLDSVELDGATVAGHSVSIRREHTRVHVLVDGRRYETDVGKPLLVKYE